MANDRSVVAISNERRGEERREEERGSKFGRDMGVFPHSPSLL